MINKPRRAALILLAVSCALGDVRPLRAQFVQQEYGPAAGMSRQMQQGVRLFDAGHDTEAMDLFLEVLTHGIPEERPLANEYLNLITQRMNVGGAMQPLQLSSIPGPSMGGYRAPPRPEAPSGGPT